MKSGVINLVSFMESQTDDDIFRYYKQINHIEEVNDTEIEAINKIFEKFKELEPSCMNGAFSGYFLGTKYTGVVSEEFDMLRFSNQKIINIELKSTLIPEDRILRQLKRHSYLLSSISTDMEVSLYTFVSEAEILYKFNEETEELLQITFEQLFEDIPCDYIEYNYLESLVDTSFIISPYSEPERFFKNQYFLNNEQEQAKKKLIESSKRYVGLKGAAGTGKSLILFDVAKELSNSGKKVLFVFCSAIYDLDTIQTINEHSSFQFIDIRKFNSVLLNNYDVVIIDESQRLREQQWKELVKVANPGEIDKLILSVDNAQTLRPEEISLDIQGILSDEKYKNAVEYVDCLTERVRTDIELSTFIRKFFNTQEKDLRVLNFPKVNAVYFENECVARDFIQSCIDNEGYISIEMPEKRAWFGNGETKLPKFYENSLDGFTVIGREYDKVLLPLTIRVTHNADGKIVVPVEWGYNYLAENGLFQAITRVKNQLLLVIIKNKALFKTIQEILTWKAFRDTQRIAKRIRAIREVHSVNVEEISDATGISCEKYIEIENSGKINNTKWLNKLAKFYHVSPQYFEGEVSEIDYSKIDLIYKKRLNGLSREQKSEIEQDIIDFIDQWGQ